MKMNAITTITRGVRSALLIWAAALFVMSPASSFAAATVTGTAEIPADVAIQAGGSASDLSKDVVTLSFTVQPSAGTDTITGMTINDIGAVGTIANLRVYANTFRNTVRGAYLVYSQTNWPGTSSAVTFTRSIAITSPNKAYFFVVYDLDNTATGNLQTSVTSLTITGTDTNWTGTMNSNLIKILAKTACNELVKVNECGNCHNFNGYFQMFYPYSSPTMKGSHAKHAGMRKYDCYLCHNKANNYYTRYTSVAPDHQDNIATIGPRIYDNVSSAVSPLGTWNNTNKTCSNVDCHYGNTTPKWGTAGTCSACHATPPATGAHTAHFNSLGITTNQTNYCYYCHDGGGSGTNHHGDGNIDITITKTFSVSGSNGLFHEKNLTASYTPSGSNDGTCANVSCHGGVTTYQWTTGMGSSSSPAASKYKITIPSGTISGRAVPATETRAAGWLKCTACHATDSLTDATATATTRFNSARSGKHAAHIGATTDATFNAYTGQVGGTNFDRKRIRVAKCYVCHNDAHYDNAASDYRFKVAAGQYNLTTIDFDANTGGTAAPNNMGGAINGNTIYSYTDGSNTVRTLGSTPSQNVYYMDTASTYVAGTCSTNCHGGGTWSYTATLDCTTCHAQVQGGSVANVMAEFGMSSHHVQLWNATNSNWTVNAQHCYTCHWEASYNAGNTTYFKNTTYHGDRRADLVIYDIANNARPTTSNTATRVVFNRLSTFKHAGANQHCLGCHNESGKTSTPFGDGKNPNSYSWDGSSVYARFMTFKTYSAHNYNPTTYNVVPQKRKTSSSHYYMNVHRRGVMVGGNWSDDQSTYLDAGTNTATNAGSTACLDCHNSHGSNLAYGNFGFSSYSSATGKFKGSILKQTWAGTHGYGVNYVPTEAYYANNLGGASSGRSAVWSAQAALCFDCHLGEDAVTGGVGTGTTSMPRNYMQYGRAKGNIIAGYYDAINYESAVTNRQTIHGKGRWYIDNSNAGYSNVTNSNSPAFWTGEFLYKKGTIIGTHFQKHPGNTVNGYTPINWRNSTNSGNTNSFMRGKCTYCHDPHGVNSMAGSPKLANISYYSPQLKGMHLTALYFEDRPGDRNTNNVFSQATYMGFNFEGANTLTNTKVAPRNNPNKALNKPRQAGNGYGFGDGLGKGQDGFFIDDNTFGVTVNNGTTAIDMFTANYNAANYAGFWFSTRNGATKVYRTGGTITTNMITENESQFGGLCLGCHPKNTLVNSVSAENTRSKRFVTHAHKTVKGWAALGTYSSADVVPNYYVNRNASAAGISRGFVGAADASNMSLSQQFLYSNGGSGDFRGIDANLRQSGYPIVWGLHLPKQASQTQTNNVQHQYHNFPCSKCHTPHQARLPRLLKTNCLDVWQSKDMANNWTSGNTLFRQKHAENANNWIDRMKLPSANYAANNTSGTNLNMWNPARAARCHNSPLVKDATNQTRWNDITPWN